MNQRSKPIRMHKDMRNLFCLSCKGPLNGADSPLKGRFMIAHFACPFCDAIHRVEAVGSWRYVTGLLGYSSIPVAVQFFPEFSTERLICGIMSVIFLGMSVRGMSSKKVRVSLEPLPDAERVAT